MIGPALHSAGLLLSKGGMKTGFHWRNMTMLDLPMVEAIAAEVHPGFPEDMAVFVERLRLYPEGARLLEVRGRPAGYVLSHPWRFRSLPALNSLLGHIPAEADTYYLHDLALLPVARGSGAAGTLVHFLLRHAEQAGFASMSLVAVNGSMPFWSRHGFAIAEAGELTDKLKSYEDAARFMVRELR
jgi:GNAT superfamily N-acetyltransferase